MGEAKEFNLDNFAIMRVNCKLDTHLICKTVDPQWCSMMEQNCGDVQKNITQMSWV